MKKLILLSILAISVIACGPRYETVKGDPLGAKICTLDNGLKIYMSVNKDEPRIQTYIAVHAGGKDDPSDNTGLAHYLEHMMFKGTEQFGTQDYEAEKPLLAQIDSLYDVYRTLTDQADRDALYHQIDSVSLEASKIAIPNEYDKLMSIIGSEGSNAFTSNDVTCYVEEIPSNQVDAWARIQADRFMNCVFRGFHTELEAVYEEKNMGLTDDGEKAIDALDSMLFVHHPYGTQTVIGTQDHLKNPSLSAIRRQKDTYYVPNNVAICLSGDFDPDEMVRTIKKYFGQWKPNPALPERSIAPEDPILEPKEKDVYGYDAEFVMLGWRTPGESFPESEISEIAGDLLFNGKAGLVDRNLLQSQAILGGGFFNYNRSDWGLMLAEGMPKEGQSLQEVLDLLLGEVDKLRKGEFSEELLEAVKANNKLSMMQGLTSNRYRTTLFMNSFINGTSWKWEAGKLDRMSKVSKEDVVAWANKYLPENGYAVVFKHLGEDRSIKKIDAPKITPIYTNRDKQSAFLAEIAASEPAPIEPVFVDYEKDMTVADFDGLRLLYKKNERNDIASIAFRYDRGSDNDPVLSVAADYFSYLGSDKYSAEDFAMTLYGLACSATPRVGGNTTAIYLEGLSENLPAALEALEYQLRNVQPDEDILSEFKADILRSREDSKKNQRACSSALQNYLIYGPEYIKAGTLTNAAVSALESDDVLESLEDLLEKRHTILYYGPASLDQVKEMLSKYHPTEDLEPLEKTHPVKRLTPSAKVYVSHYDSRQFNYVQYSDRGEGFSLEEAPYIDLFNEYYGGGMNAIVFQEMRESRALAYGAGAWLSEPAFKADTYSFRAHIASQNDKLRKAVEGFEEIIETLPEAPENLEIAKAAILGKLRTQRVIGEQVLYSYLQAQELGLTEPREKLLFEKVGALTMEDLKATHAKWIAGRTYNNAIMGDTRDIDMAYLKTLGPVQIAPLTEIFGY